MICQHFYWPVIRESIQKEFINCEFYQFTKRPTKKCGKLPPKLAEETPSNKLCVDIIGLYKISRKIKEPLFLKAVTVIDPVTRWFDVTQYSDKKVLKIAKLVETTWLVRYPWQVEIMYNQGGEFLGHEFKNSLIEN